MIGEADARSSISRVFITTRRREIFGAKQNARDSKLSLRTYEVIFFPGWRKVEVAERHIGGDVRI
jgi:hypothetical protein